MPSVGSGPMAVLFTWTLGRHLRTPLLMNVRPLQCSIPPGPPRSPSAGMVALIKTGGTHESPGNQALKASTLETLVQFQCKPYSGHPPTHPQAGTQETLAFPSFPAFLTLLLMKAHIRDSERPGNSLKSSCAQPSHTTLPMMSEDEWPGARLGSMLAHTSARIWSLIHVLSPKARPL